MLEFCGNARREIYLGLWQDLKMLPLLRMPKSSSGDGGTTNTNDTLILLLKNGFDGKVLVEG
jgi:hypothetical protein